eukprot:TRINITY_DN32882_c0_g1_i1.p1 TRINITY_DN32882_c0_g1~~TRINITY_DN32882_c0_g1_i1.p1  ORF type:complete len:286 (-),score=84.75 TRINITY_DN32882_c0_g1_i1:118-975(-)
MSASPIIHNTGFQENKLDWWYGRCNTAEVEEVVATLMKPSTGGGSVTIPHKETIMPHMTTLSDPAKAIGAVNTITKGEDGALHGDNTDWLGIRGQLEPLLGESGPADRVGLVIGAGGTAQAACYAFREMGFSKILVHNRTTERAQNLCEKFGARFECLVDLAELRAVARLDAVMATIPGSAGFQLPAGVLDALRPVVIDAAYKSSDKGSRHTPLLLQAKDAGCAVVEGMEMLFEQGCAQCEIWTGQQAPRQAIASALLEARFSGEEEEPPVHLVQELKNSANSSL